MHGAHAYLLQGLCQWHSCEGNGNLGPPTGAPRHTLSKHGALVPPSSSPPLPPPPVPACISHAPSEDNVAELYRKIALTFEVTAEMSTFEAQRGTVLCMDMMVLLYLSRLLHSLLTPADRPHAHPMFLPTLACIPRHHATPRFLPLSPMTRADEELQKQLAGIMSASLRDWLVDLGAPRMVSSALGCGLASLASQSTTPSVAPAPSPWAGGTQVGAAGAGPDGTVDDPVDVGKDARHTAALGLVHEAAELARWLVYDANAPVQVCRCVRCVNLCVPSLSQTPSRPLVGGT